MGVDELLTTREAAELLGVTTRTVARRVDAGSLQAARQLPGATGAYLFHRTTIEAALAAATTSTTAQADPA